MPYIDKKLRFSCDEVIKKMMQMNIQADGRLNYILFKFCKEEVKPSYNNYKNYIGELQECVTEIRRKLLAEYEDKKIIENGDI